jgi:hypothetical protein
VVRKQLFSRQPEERLPAEAYTRNVNDRVYAALEERKRRMLAAGRSAIIDAVAALPAERAAFAELARKAGAEFTGIWLEAPAATLLSRVAQRGKDASDATASVLQQQLTYDLGTIDWVRVDADQPKEAVIDAIGTAIRVDRD